MVYKYTLSYDGIQKTMNQSLFECHSFIDIKTNLQTPSMLLVNHQISSEALQCLHQKQLVVNCPPSCGRAGYLLDIVPPESFNRIRRIKFELPEMTLIYDSCDCSDGKDDPAEVHSGSNWLCLLSTALTAMSGATMIEELCLQAGFEEQIVIRGNSIKAFVRTHCPCCFTY